MKIFFATYIDDVNPSTGDAAGYLEACMVRDEEGNATEIPETMPLGGMELTDAPSGRRWRRTYPS